MHRGIHLAVGEILDHPRSRPDAEQQARISQILQPHSSQETQEAWAVWVFLRIRDEVERIWPLVEALAKALLERETLTYREARAIVHAALHPAGQ
jgi:hypothetical protein